MAIKSRLTHADNGATHTMTLWVAFDPGPGLPGTTDVNVTFTWDTDTLTNPSGASPAGAFVSPGAGVAVWQSVSVDRNGTEFTLTLGCTAGGGDGLFQAVPEEVGATVAPQTYTVLPSC